MKSLKSRLRRQDATGSASSGPAAASAVSPAARARSSLCALPSRGVLSGLEARARSLAFFQRSPLRQPQRLLSLRGLCVGPETLRTLSSPHSGLAGTLPHCFPGLRTPGASGSNRPLLLRPYFSLVPHPWRFPGDPRSLPRSPLTLDSGLAPRGLRRASLSPRGCGPGRGVRTPHPGGQNSGPSLDSGPSMSPRLGGLSATRLVGRLMLAVVSLSLAKFDF